MTQLAARNSLLQRKKSLWRSPNAAGPSPRIVMFVPPNTTRSAVAKCALSRVNARAATRRHQECPMNGFWRMKSAFSKLSSMKLAISARVIGLSCSLAGISVTTCQGPGPAVAAKGA